MRLSKEYYGHKENFCVGCYCLSSPFFMCIHNPLPWIFKTFLVYNWMLIVLKTTIHTLLTLIVLKKMWGASSLILILWPLTKTYVVYNHEFGHMKIFYQIEIRAILQGLLTKKMPSWRLPRWKPIRCSHFLVHWACHLWRTKAIADYLFLTWEHALKSAVANLVRKKV